MPTRTQIRLAAAHLAAVILLLCLAVVFAQSEHAQQREEHSNLERAVPFVPTPPEIVEKMLQIAEVTSDDRVYDLGSGDGRIVIMAAQKFGARAIGIELDPKLVEESQKKIADLGLGKRAQIIQGNMFESDFRPATVVTLYLLTVVNERLRPVLEKQLRPGTRVVSHDFEMPGWKAEKAEKVTSANGLSHTVYLYRRP